MTEYISSKKGFYEAVTPNWNPVSEAFFFYCLLCLGKTTPEQCESDILMSEEQRDWLVRAEVVDRRTARELFRQRLRTWRAFRRMLAHPEDVKDRMDAERQQEI